MDRPPSTGAPWLEGRVKSPRVYVPLTSMLLLSVLLSLLAFVVRRIL